MPPIELVSGSEARVCNSPNEQWIREHGSFDFLEEGTLRLCDWKCLVPHYYVEREFKIFCYEPETTDIIIAGYPFAGCYELAEAMWNICHNADCTNLDKENPLFQRVPLLELAGVHKSKSMRNIFDPTSQRYSIKSCQAFFSAMKRPRIIMTHLPYEMLSPDVKEKSKFIYIQRKPSEVLDGTYSLCRYLKCYKYTRTLYDYVRVFMSGNVPYGDYYEHMDHWLSQMSKPNCRHLTYEELSKPETHIFRELAKFCNVQITKDDMNSLIQRVSPKTVKKELDHYLKEKNLQGAFVDAWAPFRRCFTLIPDKPSFDIDKMLNGFKDGRLFQNKYQKYPCIGLCTMSDSDSQQ